MLNSLFSQYFSSAATTKDDDDDDREYQRTQMKIIVEKDYKYLNELWTHIYYPSVNVNDSMWWEAKSFLHQLLSSTTITTFKNAKHYYEVLIYLGDLSRYKNKFASSLSYYVEARKLDPNNPLAFNQIALTHSLQDDYVSSINSYLDAIERKNQTSLRNFHQLLRQIYHLRDDLLALKMGRATGGAAAAAVKGPFRHHNRCLLSLIIKQFSLIILNTPPSSATSNDNRVMNSIKRLLKRSPYKAASDSEEEKGGAGGHRIKGMIIKAATTLQCCPQQISNLIFLIIILADASPDEVAFLQQNSSLIPSSATPMHRYHCRRLKYNSNKRRTFVMLSNQLLLENEQIIPSLFEKSTNTTLLIPIGSFTFLQDNSCPTLLKWIMVHEQESKGAKVRLQRKHEPPEDPIEYFNCLGRIYNVILVVEDKSTTLPIETENIIVTKDLTPLHSILFR